MAGHVIISNSEVPTAFRSSDASYVSNLILIYSGHVISLTLILLGHVTMLKRDTVYTQ